MILSTQVVYLFRGTTEGFTFRKDSLITYFKRALTELFFYGANHPKDSMKGFIDFVSAIGFKFGMI